MKVVMLAGGIANELRPLTEKRPSTLLPILNVPILKGLIEALPEETDEVFIAAGFGGKSIEEFIDENNFSLPIHVHTEKKPLGTAGAIKSFEEHLEETFLVVNADMVTTMRISPMIDFHKAHGGEITCALHEHPAPFNFGIFGLDEDDKVVRYLEKPKPDQVFSTLVNAGIYLFTPKVLEFIPRRSFAALPELFTRLIRRKTISVYGYPFKEYWAEIGTPKKYLKAHVELLNRSMEFDVSKAEIVFKRARLIPPMIVGKNSRIEEAIVGPDVTIGADCKIASNAKLQRSVLMDRVEIGENAMVRNSIIGEDVKIEKNCLVEGAILGDGCIIRKGVKVANGGRVWPGRKVRYQDVHEGELYGGEL